MRLLLVLAISLNGYAQHKADTVFCDCNTARNIMIGGVAQVNKTIAPKGIGLYDEISPSKLNTRFAFEKEHNSAWYKLIIKATGKLSFEITPAKADDDYDFMLFKANTKNFCDSLLSYKINPVRACISRDKAEINGKTGLNHQAKETLVKQGVGSAYAKVMEVKAGEVYYLVLDNVYDQGDGHSIRFEISELVSFKGSLKNEQDKAVAAEVSLSDQSGEIIFKTETRRDGRYSFSYPIIANRQYALNFYNDSNFTYTRSFTLKDTAEISDLKTVLPSLKKGNKYSVGTIHFHPNEATTLPASRTAMRNLYKLMRKNPALRIRIIGHCNGMIAGKENAVTTLLSKERAQTLKRYLTTLGIEESRIETDGKGDSEMLFPYTPMRTEGQQVQNRRVELFVIDY